MSKDTGKCKDVYLDFNATTPLAKEVNNAIVKALKEDWGNPSSLYSLGVKAKGEIDKARRLVADMIGAPEATITFTSGGTESNNLAIYSAYYYYKRKCPEDVSNLPHVITTNIEHDSVTKLVDHLAKIRMIQKSVIPVSKDSGCIDVQTVMDRIREETFLVSVMAANNETGLMQPIAELGEKIEILNKSRPIPVLFHSDCAQIIGKINTSISELKVHYLTICGHKFYGPRIGALYAREVDDQSLITPIFYGGCQERSLRPGTENTPMIVGLGQAATLVIDNIVQYEQHMKDMRDYLETELINLFGEKIEFNNVRKNACRLPNTISAAFLYEDINSKKLLSTCPTIFASAGAACHGNQNTSILVNSGVKPYSASRTVRFSVGRETTKHDVDNCIKALKLAFFL